jgi:hypothetical protein
MKKIILAILVLGVIGIAIAYFMYNKPHSDIGSATAAFTMDAPALLAEFTKDEALANQTYIGKIIAVSGVVTETSKDDKGNVSVTLDTGDPLAGVRCNLDFVSKPKRTEFQTGEKVSFKGECSGFIELTGVVLDRCVEQ